MAEITVTYERKFSDGNFGSEGLSLSWATTYDDSESDAAADPVVIAARCAHITESLREAVLTELAKSKARNVAYAAQRELNPPAPAALKSPVEPDMEDMPF